MGARVYISGLGRFTSVDPQPGGGANAYVYAVDPLNSNDYSGKWVAYVWAPSIIEQIIAADKTAHFKDGGSAYVAVTIPKPQSQQGQGLKNGSAAVSLKPYASSVGGAVASSTEWLSRGLKNGGLKAWNSAGVRGCALGYAGSVIFTAAVRNAVGNDVRVTAGSAALGCFIGGSGAVLEEAHAGAGNALENVTTSLDIYETLSKYLR